MQKASKSDIKKIEKLLVENDLPISDLQNEIDFFVIKNKNQVIATGGLEPAGDAVILRSVAIDDKFKARGLGKDMTRFLIEKAKNDNYNAVYLLTTTAENYFPKFGFSRIMRNSAPNSIKASSEFTAVCPDSAILMKLNISR